MTPPAQTTDPKPLRVLITSPIFPPDLGGPSVYVPSVGRFLVERGHTVRVIAFCSDPDPSGYPFEVVSVPRGPLPVRYLKAFWQVLRQAGQFDVVYVQEHLALLHVLAAKLRRKPAVIRIMVDGAWEIAHRKGWCGDDDIVQFQAGKYGFKVGLSRRLQRVWWGWCYRLISCSEFLRQITIQTYGVPEDKVKRIFNAYHGPRFQEVTDTRESAQAALAEEGLAPTAQPDGTTKRRYLLTICRLMVWKDVGGIIEALSELPEDVHLLVAGDGDMEEPWKQLAAKLALTDRVHFLGNVAHKHIPRLIRAADIFVLNSRYEGLSHTLLEVSALGTPIICTGVCGNPEVVEDGVNGFLVPTKDPHAIAVAASKLLTDKDLGQRFADEGQARMGRFNREATFTEVESVLRGAAEKKAY